MPLHFLNSGLSLCQLFLIFALQHFVNKASGEESNISLGNLIYTCKSTMLPKVCMVKENN
jgi:hypothetical protein